MTALNGKRSRDGEMVPENFNSVEAIYEMIQRLQEK